LSHAFGSKKSITKAFADRFPDLALPIAISSSIIRARIRRCTGTCDGTCTCHGGGIFRGISILLDISTFAGAGACRGADTCDSPNARLGARTFSAIRAPDADRNFASGD